MAGLPGGLGALADWGSFAVFPSSLMCCLSQVSLVGSGCPVRALGLAAAWRGSRLSSHTASLCGVSRDAPWQSESQEDVLLGDCPL